MLQDIAVLTGGTVVSDEVGLTLAKATLADLGRAKRVEVGKEDTTLIGGAGDAGGHPGAHRQHPQGARGGHQRLRPRKARRAHRQAVGRRGADQGRRGHRDRAEGTQDPRRRRPARHARGGRGGHRAGRRRRAAARAARARRPDGATLDEDSGIRLVARALEEPLRRIVDQRGRRAFGGAEPGRRVDRTAPSATTRPRASYGDLLQMGVIDPAKVTRLALQNAASIASLILTTDCMIANAPQLPTAGGGMAGMPDPGAYSSGPSMASERPYRSRTTMHHEGSVSGLPLVIWRCRNALAAWCCSCTAAEAADTARATGRWQRRYTATAWPRCCLTC